MKIKDFLSILSVAVLAIILLLSKCSGNRTNNNYADLLNRYNELVNSKTQDSFVIDSLLSLPAQIDTVITESKVYITKTRILPKYDTITVVKIDTVDYEVASYNYANSEGNVIVTDSLLIKGIIVSHKQDIYTTCRDTTITKEVLVPVVKEVPVKMKQGFSVWAGIRSDYTLIPHPVLSLNYRDYSITAAKGINNENDFTIQLQTKIRFK